MSGECGSRRGLSRRAVIAGAGGFVVLRRVPAAAAPDELETAMREHLGVLALREGRIELDIPALVENGNSVPLHVRVESPMTSGDHVTDIFVFSPENPLPRISHFRLGPRCGKAEIKTTIRLATTQHVHVVAVLKDGTQWLATVEVEVTTAACFDPT